MCEVEWLDARFYRTSRDLSRPSGAADDFFVPTVHKRSMSWLLAAVMSICEEDPRKCRALERGRHRLRIAGPGGKFVVVDADAGALSMALLNDDEPAYTNGLLAARDAYG